MKELDGKVALITGAGSGMAKASTRLFVERGARVVAADISGAENDTAAEVGEGVHPVHCDVSQETDVEAAVQAAIDEFGRLDVVLNVAGIGTPQPLAELAMSELDRIIDVNLRGVLLGMKHGIRAMVAGGHGGAIVNWSSVGGLGASAFPTTTYAATKAAVISATKSAAVEHGKDGIRVNAVCPGFIQTEIMGASGGKKFPEMFQKAALGRAGEPNEVAEVAAFLASDRAAFVSGAIIPVDGGWAAKLA